MSIFDNFQWFLRPKTCCISQKILPRNENTIWWSMHDKTIIKPFMTTSPSLFSFHRPIIHNLFSHNNGKIDFWASKHGADKNKTKIVDPYRVCREARKEAKVIMWSCFHLTMFIIFHIRRLKLEFLFFLLSPSSYKNHIVMSRHSHEKRKFPRLYWVIILSPKILDMQRRKKAASLLLLHDLGGRW